MLLAAAAAAAFPAFPIRKMEKDCAT
jgi:hypothetical protein